MNAFRKTEELLSRLNTETIKAYSEIWGEGNELDRFLIDSYVNKSLIDYIQSRKICIDGKKVLEFGCRDGSSFMAFLFLKAGKITGMDIDENILELSGKIYADLGCTNVEYRVNRVGEPLPCEEEEFDIVSCNAVLEHINPDLRGQYLKELQTKVKNGGYLIVSDTPNRLWPKEGHTTGIWFLNYLPFKLKCRLGSMTTRYKGIRHDDYDFWIEQGIQGVTYKDVYRTFDKGLWSIGHDLQFGMEFRNQIFNDVKRSFPKKLIRYILFLFASVYNLIFLKPVKHPSLAISPSLIFSFRKK